MFGFTSDEVTEPTEVLRLRVGVGVGLETGSEVEITDLIHGV